jgi:hypothetical protein
MNIYIINFFILQNNPSLIDIYKHITLRYKKTVDINDITVELTKLIKHHIIIFYNKIYELTEEGNVILNVHKYYYSKIIIRFLNKCTKTRKKYELKEIRKEQQQLRNYLITTKPHICILCDKKLPLCLLESAHLKPRCILNNNEINDKNVVEFMCRYCHNLYDNGFLAVYNGLLQVSSFIQNYDLHYNKNKQINYYNLQNDKYFSFHYKYIYKINISAK